MRGISAVAEEISGEDDDRPSLALPDARAATKLASINWVDNGMTDYGFPGLAFGRFRNARYLGSRFAIITRDRGRGWT
jgi:hypothetical protein